jgi:hypothetical protein
LSAAQTAEPLQSRISEGWALTRLLELIELEREVLLIGILDSSIFDWLPSGGGRTLDFPLLAREVLEYPTSDCPSGILSKFSPQDKPKVQWL